MELVGEERHQPVVEFELGAVLVPQLVDTVEELDKDLRSVAHVRLRVVLASLGEHVPERDPIFLNQDLEPIKCAVVRVE